MRDEGVCLVHERAGIRRQHRGSRLASEEMARTLIVSDLVAEDPDGA